MSNEEIICTWMEPKPNADETYWYPARPSPQRWWMVSYGRVREVDGITGEPSWQPRFLSLDALREVQDRLIDEQWEQYESWLCRIAEPFPPEHWPLRVMLHVTALQKIKALAATLRPVVEAAHKDKVAAE